MRFLLRNEVILIVSLGLIFFFPYLGAVHLFDWDEINFAECSREMMLLHDYSRIYIDFQPFWEKPPMFFWMQSSAMALFGVTEFAARFPNAVCGMVTLLVVFLCGTKLYDRKFGLFWALAFGGSLFPHLYFKSGIIDPWFNLFTFLSLYFIISYQWIKKGYHVTRFQHQPLTYVCLSALFMGLAVLTKGQAALIIFLLVVGIYILYHRFKVKMIWWHGLLFFLIVLFVTSAWYGYEIIKNGPTFILEFMRYQYRLFSTHDAGHEGFFGYHFVVILLGCFPASVLALPSFFKSYSTVPEEKDFRIWMIILFWVVMILFTMVQSRIIHYSSLAWFPVTFLAAYSFYKWDRKEVNLPGYVFWLFTIIGGIISLLLLAVPFIAIDIRKIIPLVKDEFARAAMMADVHWSGWEAVAGLIMMLVILKGIQSLTKRRYITSAWRIFGGTAIVIFFTSLVLIPKIERYSQGAAIDFFIERQGEDCYVQTLGYKTYADLFYTKKTRPDNDKYYDTQWLLSGDIDKPVYFVTKLDRVEKYKSYTDIQELYRKNGFVFLKRTPPRE
jgi:4-amino-4-deoxy-L-arabinose transferase-like glycosyltransferase